MSDDNATFDVYEESDDETDVELGDGTSADARRFGRIVEDEPKSVSKVQGRLRMRREPEFPPSIRKTTIVDSHDYFSSRRHRKSLGSLEDQSETDGISSTTESGSELNEDEVSHESVISQSEDRDSVAEIDDEEGAQTLKIARSLLEAQWKIEDRSKKEFELIQKKDRAEHRKLLLKSQHSQNQISLWKSLVSIRIHLQKVLTDANRLPFPFVSQLFYQQQSSNSEQDPDRSQLQLAPSCDAVRKHCSESIIRLLSSLHRLQLLQIQHNANVSKVIASVDSASQDDVKDNDSYQTAPSSIELRKRRRREYEAAPFDSIQKESRAWKIVDNTPRKVMKWAMDVADQWASKVSIKIRYSKLKEMSKCEWSSLSREMLAAASRVGALSARLKKLEAENRKDRYLKLRNDKKIRYVPIDQLIGFMTAEPTIKQRMTSGVVEGNENDAFVNQLIGSLFQNVDL